MTEPRGEVYDIGYQRYDGPREGRARARKAVWINGVRTALGLGRGWTSKILPGLLLLALMIPALVFTLIASTLPVTSSEIHDHSDYYQIASIVLLIFSAIIAPELLTADRRNGVINLYFVRPMSPTDYVVGRWLAFFSITLVLVYLPQIALLTGLTLGADIPLDHLRDNWQVVPRFLGAGFVLALFTTTIPLSVASFTTRRAYAAAIVIGIWVIAAVTGNALVEELQGENIKWFALIDLRSVPIYINDMIFAKVSDSDINTVANDLPRAAVIAWYLALVVVPGTLLWWRYRNLRV